jgi:hypothetical protein
VLDFCIFAGDEDLALEAAGNGADAEFESPEHAAREFDPEFHGGKKLYRIRVEEVECQKILKD